MDARPWLLALALAGCGEPVLRNVPHPPTAAVAGVAAAAAAAATLADPAGAAKRQESRDRQPDNNRGVTVHETVPAGVFDRLDQGSSEAGSDAGSGARAAPTVPPAAPPGPIQLPVPLR